MTSDIFIRAIQHIAATVIWLKYVTTVHDRMGKWISESVNELINVRDGYLNDDPINPQYTLPLTSASSNSYLNFME